jgi:aryl-alcohol dehydrogenase-like predicted oxidoreductase
MFPRFQPGNFEKNFDVVRKLEEIADKKGVKVGQLGLAWLMKQGHGTGILPIFGTRTLNRVEENLGALKVIVTPDEEKVIRELVDRAGSGGDYGGRYPAGMDHFQLRDTPALKE